MRIASVLLCLSLIACPGAMAEKPKIAALVGDRSITKSFSGNVSWYGKQFHGRKTASGERFDMNKCTSAHRSLPFFTKVLVEDPKTGKAVLVKVNDRGPFVKSRVMDLSMEAAKRLGTISRGMAFVDCMVISDK